MEDAGVFSLRLVESVCEMRERGQCILKPQVAAYNQYTFELHK